MGNTYNFIEAEQKTWLEHSLQYDVYTDEDQKIV